MSGQQIAALGAELRQLKAKHQGPQANFELFMKSLQHAVEVAGVDHVGIGIDWDGGGGVSGLEDATDLPKITAQLLSAGYSRADIEKIMSGNILRVLRQAESYAQAQRENDR
jgi:membrane dipeptidase